MAYGATFERPNTRYFALAEEETREPTVIDKLKNSALYRWGLVDDVYLSSKASERELMFFTSVMSHMKAEFIGETALVVTSGVLTRNAFIEAAKQFNTVSSVDTWSLGTMLAPDVVRRSALPLLINKRILTTRTLWQNFLVGYTSHGQSFYNKAWRTNGFPWKYLADVVNPEKIGTGVHGHGIDAVESQALAKDVFRETEKSKLYPLDENAHPLVKKLRGQENTARMSKQIEVVIGKESRGNGLEDLDKVFTHYLKRSKYYSAAIRRGEEMKKLGLAGRIHNVRKVNMVQEWQMREDDPNFDGRKISKHYDPEKRHFDIYARYGMGHMDPLQLAFISKAAEWYIMGGRSKLFNSVRVVPYRNYWDEVNVPSIAVAACKGSSLLTVSGEEFETSIMGANRLYLTHSQSMESVNMHSIAIIGLATFRNSFKHSGNIHNHVVFEADFDPKDKYRFKTPGGYLDKALSGNDANGDILGLIDESLRTMMECEDREIGRADKRIATATGDNAKLDDLKRRGLGK